MLQSTAVARFFKVPELDGPQDFVSEVAFPHISRSLANGSCQQPLQRGGCFAFTSPSPEQRSKGRKTRMEDAQAKREGGQNGKSRGETKRNNEEDRKNHKVPEEVFSCLFVRYTSWQWSGNKEVSSQSAVMFYIWSHFLLDADWARWGIVAQSCLPQEGSVIRRILSRDVLQCHLEITNSMKQLQPSSSWVTVVTGPTNPLTHLLDCYLALDSIS